MSGRIERRFDALRNDGRTGLVPFVTAGDPAPGVTVPVLHALVEAGADLVELGVPFSDPMADGPVIQAASERAIAAGVDLQQVLAMVREFRADDPDTPVVLMGYLNPVERYGAERFAADAADAGVDGVLLVDWPPEEWGALGDAVRTAGLRPICMVAPTTGEARLERLVERAQGFVYYVSFKGITGAARLQAESLEAPLAALRRHVDLPVAVGFGITDAESACTVARSADAVVIGSALVDRLAGKADQAAACEAARGFLAPIRRALDNERRSKRTHGA